MEKWLVNVPVATVWTSPDSAREIDRNAVSNPGNIEAWLNSLTYETRLELCGQNLVQTQVLYGQEVLMIEEDDHWAYVVVPEQHTSKNDAGYPGWIPKSQLLKSKEEWNLQKGPLVVVTGLRTILTIESNLELSFQTTLPLVREDKDIVSVKTPDGKIGTIPRGDIIIFQSLTARFKGTGKDIVSAGEQFVGLPYLWGGMSSWGYDCSGFSYSMCKANGYLIPRDAHDQAEFGKAVPFAEKKPGDLLFFAYEEGKGQIHHVGIYYGEGKMLHAPKTGKSVEIIPLADTIYEKELCAVRNIWEGTEK